MSKLSLVSNFYGQKARVHTGSTDFVITVSSAPFLSLSKIVPLNNPIARI